MSGGHPRPIEQRLWEKVDRRQADKCWEWQGALVGGYGSIGRGTGTTYAHRVAYELTYEAISDGKEIHHLCENRLCVNPAHLLAVTRSEHRALHTSDYCTKGHPLVLRANGRHRECRVCNAARDRRNLKHRNAQQRGRRRKKRESGRQAA